MKLKLPNKRLIVLLCLLGLVLYGYATARKGSYRNYSKESSGISTIASKVKTDTVQIFSARTWGMKGMLAHHTWLSYIRVGDPQYTVAHIIGWRRYRGKSVLVIEKDIPDRLWYGNHPNLIDELTGSKAAKAIKKIESLLKSYPHKNNYVLWPGPNSNTFTAHIIRNIDGLKIELPVHAIGKDYLLTKNSYFGVSQTGTGYQFSIKGLFGVTLGLKDGVEVNILSLCFGVDFIRPALKLPIIGRIGFSDRP